MLLDGRSSLIVIGDCVSVADLAAYSNYWLLSTQGGQEALARLPFAALHDWASRVAAFGHGKPVEMTAGDALDVAKRNEPSELNDPAGADPSGIAIGSQVIITPDDTGREGVRGRLLASDAESLTIRIENDHVGEVNVHFPRAGFDVVRA